MTDRRLLSVDDNGLGENKQLQYERSLQLGTFKNLKRKEELTGLLDSTKIERGDGRASETTMGEKSLGCSFGTSRRLISFLEEWFFLALLGFSMAVCSLTMDIAIDQLQNVQYLMFNTVKHYDYILLSYAAWVSYVCLLITCSALFVHYVAPQAIGSGIPEMKTILRGVVLKEYLTFRTLVSKMVGLTLSLGSGVPMGKEGPFVHVASVVANLLSNLKHGKSKVFENELYNTEMLAAGCAVGVACTFSAPVGGVLFSIEVTSVFFAVRNYWRGFFAAIVSASLFRMFKLLHKTAQDVVSVQAHFQTRFPVTDAFLPTELPFFIFLGLVCGLAGALFVFLHRSFVLFLRKSKIIKRIFVKYWLFYPVVVAIVISLISFPLGAGAYLGGEQRFTAIMGDLFTDCALIKETNRSRQCSEEIMLHWTGPQGETSIFFTLSLFFFVFYFLSLLSSTLPVPNGIFLPVFVLGSVVGRLMGEGLAIWFPLGMDSSLVDTNGLPLFPIRPGAYAVVGAAAMCGAVTHTVSIVVIVMELTGQLALLVPVMIAVLTANGICSLLQDSIYDSIIKMKRLPYLPDISHSTSVIHKIRADQVMKTPVRFVAKDTTYGELQETLIAMPGLRAFPLVDSKGRMSLIGSIGRSQLTKLVENHVGIKARQAEARRRVQEGITDLEKRMKVGEKKEKSKREEAEQTEQKKKFTVSKVDRLETPKKYELEAPFPMGVKRHVVEQLEAYQREMEEMNYHTIGGMFRSLTRKSLGKHKKPVRDEFDLYEEARTAWQQKVLNETVDLSRCNVDSSPFQIVEQTSLFKVHSLFSLLGLHRAYVSSSGQLVGVLSLKELRAALELVLSGNFPQGGESMTVQFEEIEDDEPEDFIQPKLEVLTRDSLESYLDDDEKKTMDSPCDQDKIGLVDETTAPKRKKSFHIRITEPDE